jgi:competence protein ComFC
MECRGKTFFFEHNHSVGIYGEEIKELISCYKTGKIRSLGELFAEILSKAYFERYPGLPVVPVPSRPSSVRRRGFDQMLVICEIFRKRHGIEVLSCLKRGGRDREQKTLNREERKKNLSGSIGINNSIKPPFPKALVLLDDVFTTGATVNECAGILKSHGVLQVFSLTFARD